WRISQEHFWKVKPEAISDLKLRVSYGSLGNNNITPYAFLDNFSISTASIVFNNALPKYTSSPDPIPAGLTWETATTTDIGLDAGFLKSRLRLTADYYIRKTTDMYTVGPTLPDVFGADAPKGNYADMTTKGFEVSLSWRDSFKLGNKPFNYDVKFTLADYISTIDKYNNINNSLDDYYEGQRLGEIWGYQTDGLFQSQEEIDNWATGIPLIFPSGGDGKSHPGDMKIADLDGSGDINNGDKTLDNHGDMKVIGNSAPRFIYSITLGADWNNIFVSAFFQGVGKQDWYPSSESLFWGQYNRTYNQLPTWHLDNYWTEDNRDAYLPRYVGYTTINAKAKESRYLQSVAYIRLKNLQVGYTLPKKWLSKAGIEKLSIYFSGENLWCWSPLYRHTRDLDVMNATHGTDSELGKRNDASNNGNNYPIMRSYSLGVQLTF
ncbi:MAG: SusC/RagA family protein, partial [Alistipes sp.]